MIARLKGAEILFSPHYNDIPEQSMDAHRSGCGTATSASPAR